MNCLISLSVETLKFSSISQPLAKSRIAFGFQWEVAVVSHLVTGLSFFKAMASNSSLGAAMGGEGTADKIPGRSLPTSTTSGHELSATRPRSTLCGTSTSGNCYARGSASVACNSVRLRGTPSPRRRSCPAKSWRSSSATPPSTREEESSNFRVYITACFFLSLLVVAMLRKGSYNVLKRSTLLVSYRPLAHASPCVAEPSPRALVHDCVRR